MAEQKLETFYPGNYIFVLLFVFVFEDMCVAAGSARRKLKEEVFRRSVSLLRQSEGGVPSLDAVVWVLIVFVTSLSLFYLEKVANCVTQFEV